MGRNSVYLRRGDHGYPEVERAIAELFQGTVWDGAPDGVLWDLGKWAVAHYTCRGSLPGHQTIAWYALLVFRTLERAGIADEWCRDPEQGRHLVRQAGLTEYALEHTPPSGWRQGKEGRITGHRFEWEKEARKGSAPTVLTVATPSQQKESWVTVQCMAPRGPAGEVDPEAVGGDDASPGRLTNRVRWITANEGLRAWSGALREECCLARDGEVGDVGSEGGGTRYSSREREGVPLWSRVLTLLREAGVFRECEALAGHLLKLDGVGTEVVHGTQDGRAPRHDLRPGVLAGTRCGGKVSLLVGLCGRKGEARTGRSAGPLFYWCDQGRAHVMEGRDVRLRLDTEGDGTGGVVLAGEELQLIPTIWLSPFQHGHEEQDSRHRPFRPWLACDVRLLCVDAASGATHTLWTSPEDALRADPAMDGVALWLRGTQLNAEVGPRANGLAQGTVIHRGEPHAVFGRVADTLTELIFGWLTRENGECERGYAERRAVLHNALFHALYGNGALPHAPHSCGPHNTFRQAGRRRREWVGALGSDRGGILMGGDWTGYGGGMSPVCIANVAARKGSLRRTAGWCLSQ